MPSRLSLILQSATVAALTSAGAFIVITKHTAFEPYDPATDPTFQTLLSSRVTRAPTSPTQPQIESCVRRVPLKKLDRAFLKDMSETNGSLLAEAFVKGVFSGLGYAPKRFTGFFARGDQQRTLWSQEQIEASNWEVGTEVAGEWRVIARPPGMAHAFVLEEVKGEQSGREAEEGRGVLQVYARCVADMGYYEFRLRSVRSGTGRENALAKFGHRRYLEWLIETGVMRVEKIGKED